MNDEKIANFIQTYFKLRECYKYKGKSFELCECNHHKSKHNCFSDQKETWSYETNTMVRPCDTFGKIKFIESNDMLKQSCPRFIRFDYKQQDNIYECVYKLLIDYWSMPYPKLLISINGGYKRMNFKNNQVKKNFKQGLIDVIKKDNTWIISGGFNVGIHKLVSEAVHEYRLHQENTENEVKLIGISSWGVVYDNQAFDITVEDSHEYKYGNILSDQKGKVALDHYYDCYLFCDDGTDKIYDLEVEFRKEFEKFIILQDDAFIVQILFEGGKRALYSAYNMLKNKVNIVVIKGSGRAADIISKVLELSSRKFTNNLTSIINDYKEGLNILNEEVEDIKDLITDLYLCYKKQIIIYDMFDLNAKLDKTILEAIISGPSEKDLERTLKLAIRFDCPSIAEKKVFTNSYYTTINARSINSMFMEVIQKNKFEFVRLFLQNGLQIENSMDLISLQNLYLESMDVERSQCFELLNDLVNEKSWFQPKSSEQLKRSRILEDIGGIIPSISGNILRPRYAKESSTSLTAVLKTADVELRTPNLSGSSRRMVYTSVTTQDLLLWALLSGHIELAEILWEIGKDHVGTALVAATILKNMASLTLKRGDIDLEEKLKDASEKFQSYATNVVNEAYSRGKSNTYDILVRALTKWDGMTCIQIALSGNLLDFLNNSACRSYAMKVWMGNMSPFLSFWKILLNIPFSILFIKPLIIPYINYKEEEKELTGTKNVRVNNTNVAFENQVSRKSDKTKKIKVIPFCKAIKQFYQAPIVKFSINLISYIIFLAIFSFMNLCELKPIEDVTSIKEMWAEVFVCVYVVSIIVEEIRQVIDQERTGNIIYKFYAYLKGSWNIYDIFLIILFLLSIIVRYSISKDNFVVSRCIFSVSLSMFCMRTMQFYFVNQYIGPKVIMIKEMIRDILFFLSIFTIFILSYGTLAQSIKNPNSDFSVYLYKDVIYYPYFQTYGELMLDKVESSCNTSCVIKNATVVTGFGIFLLLTNVLLVNLLIAMFGYTFNQIQGNSKKHWSFIHMQLVEEFYEKPIYPPPFNLVYYIFKGIFFCVYRLSSKISKRKNSLLVKSLSFDRDYRISGYEQFCLEAIISEMNSLKGTNKSEKDDMMTDLIDLVEKVTATQDPNLRKRATVNYTNSSVQKYISRVYDRSNDDTK